MASMYTFKSIRTFNPEASAEELRAQVQALIEHCDMTNARLVDVYHQGYNKGKEENRNLRDAYFRCGNCYEMCLWRNEDCNPYEEAMADPRRDVLWCNDCVGQCDGTNYNGDNEYVQDGCYSCGSLHNLGLLKRRDDEDWPMRVCKSYPSCTLRKFRRAVTKLRHVWRWYKAGLLSHANREETHKRDREAFEADCAPMLG